MPYTAATSEPLRANLRVFRVQWSADPSLVERSVEPLRARLLSPGVDRRTERERAAGALEGLVRAAERVLAEIESLEVTKARVEADLLAAYAALHTIEAQQIDALPTNAAARASAMVSPQRVVGEEIALATGVGVGEVARRLSLATAPRRHRRILAALRSGATTLHRALQVASETGPLCDADVAAVEEAVLAPSRDGRPVSQRTFMTRLRRAVASFDTRGADERRAHARSRRGVFGRLTGDGMGCLTLVTDADAFAAVMDRLDAQARAARAAGDARTLDQLRCDLATEALLRSHLDALQAGAGASAEAAYATEPATKTTPTTSPTTSPTTGTTSATGSAFGAASGTRTHPDDANQPGGVGPVAGQPAGLVWLVVPFEVATGSSDAACELPGHGWITAAHAREIMTRPGSVWRTLPVYLRTGEALSRPTRAYRPTAAMVEHVLAVDGHCRGPGCEVPATRCDLDHETPWPRGATTVTNLHAKHRFHHNLKTDGVWSSSGVADGGLEWTTLTGRTYVTRPKNWRAGLGDRAEPASPNASSAEPAPAPDDGSPPF